MITKKQDEHYARCVEKALEMKSNRGETATLLLERTPKYNTLEKIEAALQAGIYGG